VEIIVGYLWIAGFESNHMEENVRRWKDNIKNEE
jgi:hypothetical protein